MALEYLTGTNPGATTIAFRRPTVEDGAAMWACVGRTKVLEQNTCYAYVLFAAHFADTCVLAEIDGRVAGVVIGYRPPTSPDAAFVWQIGVDPDFQGRGLGKKLLEEFIRLPGCRDANFLETTVTPSNETSRRLFRSFARDQDAECGVEPFFEARHFAIPEVASDAPPMEHEPEELFRIGPLRRP